MSEQFDQIKSTFDRFCDTWKSNDAAQVARFFADDGSLINPFGERADGRPAITAMYTQYFGSILAGTSTTFNLATVREVGNGHALADGEQTVTASDGTVVLAVHLSMLLRRDADRWSFVDARPYVFAAIPG